ncbi:hypothetical protein G6F35_013861 [Rhizopus arrhizus]|uniref:Uncharacterized protein n=1 Tax=Rhizopus delemar TaxID=936053 RepID=A0A9P7BZY9_9FUNG|nr:hypothetical protein G6F35_013861 [Rhizopus arrhizus]KAG1529591.1 hypothetical protein G6F50_017893 [Rhizopus delemar]
MRGGLRPVRRDQPGNQCHAHEALHQSGHGLRQRVPPVCRDAGAQRGVFYRVMYFVRLGLRCLRAGMHAASGHEALPDLRRGLPGLHPGLPRHARGLAPRHATRPHGPVRAGGIPARLPGAF